MGFRLPLSSARSYINIIIYTFQSVQHTHTHATYVRVIEVQTVLHQQKQMRGESHKYKF